MPLLKPPPDNLFNIQTGVKQKHIAFFICHAFNVSPLPVVKSVCVSSVLFKCSLRFNPSTITSTATTSTTVTSTSDTTTNTTPIPTATHSPPTGAYSPVRLRFKRVVKMFIGDHSNTTTSSTSTNTFTATATITPPYSHHLPLAHLSHCTHSTLTHPRSPLTIVSDHQRGRSGLPQRVLP
jgi:cytoskeletal protein RodZ